jgi:hypothetical protein
MVENGVIEIIKCCGFGSLESSHCSCFKRGKSHFEILKSQFYIYISRTFDDVHIFHKIKSCHNKILQIEEKLVDNERMKRKYGCASIMMCIIDLRNFIGIEGVASLAL